MRCILLAAASSAAYPESTSVIDLEESALFSWAAWLQSLVPFCNHLPILLRQLIVGRLVAGLGFGAIAATAPNWQSECSSASHRGAAVLFEGLFISAGLAVQGWINLGMSFSQGSVSWRFPLALPIVWASLVLAAQERSRRSS